ncbi:MAG TPA: hypothetical protein VF319_14760, partial [Caldimonas sp.]
MIGIAINPRRPVPLWAAIVAALALVTACVAPQGGAQTDAAPAAPAPAAPPPPPAPPAAAPAPLPAARAVVA